MLLSPQEWTRTLPIRMWFSFTPHLPLSRIQIIIQMDSAFKPWPTIPSGFLIPKILYMKTTQIHMPYLIRLSWNHPEDGVPPRRKFLKSGERRVGRRVRSPAYAVRFADAIMLVSMQRVCGVVTYSKNTRSPWQIVEMGQIDLGVGLPIVST